MIGKSNKMEESKNALSLQKHLDWFAAVLDARMQNYFEQDVSDTEKFFPDPPPLEKGAALDDFFIQEGMEWKGKILVMLALVPHLNPQVLDIFFTKNSLFDRGFTEFGGINAKFHNGFLPTIETAIFIIAGKDLEKRLELMELLKPDQHFFSRNIFERNYAEANEPNASARLQLNEELLHKILWNVDHSPSFGKEFPAKEIHTKLDWEDLILEDNIKEEILDIKVWLENEALIQNKWGFSKVLKPGYRCLFYGPPGTGKTLTASLLGKSLNKEVYRIDLSMVISKYIGETEKNLAKVFDMANTKNWILFFDEADALFGKRTATNSSNDRFANQEVAYLLQRVEDYPGLVILATNLKSNIDEAFFRRFQSMVYFPMPDEKQRFQLWRKLFDLGLSLDPAVDLKKVSQSYNISGGEMINVLRYLAIQVAKSDSGFVTENDIVQGIRREFRKSGKVLT